MLSGNKRSGGLFITVVYKTCEVYATAYAKDKIYKKQLYRNILHMHANSDPSVSSFRRQCQQATQLAENNQIAEYTC